MNHYSNENMLDILVFIVENFMTNMAYHEEKPDPETLSHYLEEIGFHRREIAKAFCWLKDLAETHMDSVNIKLPQAASQRSWHVAEINGFTPRCWKFLHSLEQTNVIDTYSREIIIDRALALNLSLVDIEQLKWVVLLVLYIQPQKDHAIAYFEEMVFGENSTIH